jgi:hypothetical protein
MVLIIFAATANGQLLFKQIIGLMLIKVIINCHNNHLLLNLETLLSTLTNHGHSTAPILRVNQEAITGTTYSLNIQAIIPRINPTSLETINATPTSNPIPGDLETIPSPNLVSWAHQVI